MRTKGFLDPAWRKCLGGLEISEQRRASRPVVTQLRGRVVDQSALQGVIDTVFMLGVRLMSVERLPVAQCKRNCSGAGRMRPLCATYPVPMAEKKLLAKLSGVIIQT